MQDTVTLPDNHGFPHAAAERGDVPNLAVLAAKRVGRHSFGVTKDGAATALRLLADQIAAEIVLPQEMVDATTASVDDFTVRTLTFTFAVKQGDEIGK